MSNYGDTLARSVDARVAATVASRAALQAIPLASRLDGQMVMVEADQSQWQFVLASTAADTTGNLVLVPTDAAGGAWLRAADIVDLKLAIAFGTADAGTLFTVPAGFKLRVDRAFWEVTTSFTGGASSAVGISSTDTAFNTKGDILGGSTGDVAATLVSTGSPYKGGTIGAKYASNGVVVLVAGDTVRFDRITSAFTAGAGFAHLQCELIG